MIKRRGPPGQGQRIVVQGTMRSDAIVIVGVGSQEPTQLHLVQDNDMIFRFGRNRSNVWNSPGANSFALDQRRANIPRPRG